MVALVGDREKAAAPALAPAEPLWTRPQAAEALRVSLRHLDALTSAGVIPVVRMGRATRIRPEDVRAFLERASRDSHRGGPSHGEA